MPTPLPRLTTTTALATALLAVQACSDEPSGPPRPLAPCTAADIENLTITVGSGLEPTFDWSPRCSVNELRVEYADPELPDDPPRVAWLTFELFLSPPIRYGAPPAFGFPELFPPEPLERGRTYTVRLLQMGATPDAEIEAGWAEFVP